MKHKYTLLTLLAAFAFIVGSMAGMNFILDIREAHLLKGSGEVVMESPILAWQGYGDSAEDKPEEDVGAVRQALTIEQIEDAVKSWNSRRGVILHNPVEGQISMEEAIAAGKEWLVKMGIWEEGQNSAVKATLGVGARETNTMKVQLESYYSFWTLQFASENGSCHIILYLNAITGGVWGAEITMDNPLENRDYGSLELFVELAGLQPSWEAGITEDIGPKRLTALEIQGSRLYAQKVQDSTAIYEKEYYNIEGIVTVQVQDHIVYQLLL